MACEGGNQDRVTVAAAPSAPQAFVSLIPRKRPVAAGPQPWRLPVPCCRSGRARQPDCLGRSR